MSRKNFWEFADDFLGHRVYSATAGSNVGHSWLIKDTSAAGTPTYASVSPSASGEVKLAFDNTAEAQILTLYQNDVLQFDIDDILELTWRVKLGVTTINANTTLVFGIASAENDTMDSVAEAAWFKMDGGNSTSLVVVETDDNVTNNDDIATGKSLSSSYKDFVISFAAGKKDVKFFIDGQPVATSTTFDMSQYTGSFQLYLQVQKGANAETDSVVIDYVEIKGRRAGVI
ncbi:MAG TPA: hypothetical protein VG826_29190 [Pirellulales bacterium]|nr:hypothetical protein [Pirellulales bacterium]